MIIITFPSYFTCSILFIIIVILTGKKLIPKRLHLVKTGFKCKYRSILGNKNFNHLKKSLLRVNYESVKTN